MHHHGCLPSFLKRPHYSSVSRVIRSFFEIQCTLSDFNLCDEVRKDTEDYDSLVAQKIRGVSLNITKLRLAFQSAQRPASPARAAGGEHPVQTLAGRPTLTVPEKLFFLL